MSTTVEGNQSVQKRGRRPKGATADLVGMPRKSAAKKNAKQSIVYNNTRDDTDLKALSDDENVVLNLKVFETGTEDNNQNIEGIESSYDIADYFSKPFELLDEPSSTIDVTHFPNCDTDDKDIAQGNHSVSSLKVIELLKDFEEKNKHNEWPTNTSIHCYWCCHKFNNTPFGIPVKYINDRFHVYGCFCSLECCAAYNIDSKDAADDVWERSSLINMLARKLGYRNYVKPAPNRLALKIFGGHMDIEEFRDYCQSNRIINMNFPPMMTLTQQIEEINEADVNSDYRYIPIDTDRINKYKEKMKLKRTKPVTNFKNTLDHTMNLKYGCGNTSN